MSNVDFAFISQLEGGQLLEGYVPDPGGSQSGVTVATGFDLGSRNTQSLQNLGLPTPLVNKLAKYCGKTRFIAEQFLFRNPLTITAQEAALIDAASKSSAINALIGRYDRALPARSSLPRFEQLPGEAQTVIASVAFQYGDLPSRTPKFWKTVTEQRWQAAVAELRDFGDSYQPRRLKEANLLSQVVSGSRPPGQTRPTTPPSSTGTQAPARTTLSGSVGRGGRNDAADVRLIQALLSPRLPAGTSPLQVNGRVDQALLNAIVHFQRQVVGMASPDGRIDPGKRTFQALTGASTQHPTPTPPPPPPSTVQAPSSTRTPPSAVTPPFADFILSKTQTLSGSVGQRGQNKPADVQLIRLLLNAHLPVPAAPLQINGQVDERLLSTIIHFQRQTVGMTHPDGRIDPGGRTFQMLTGTWGSHGKPTTPTTPRSPTVLPVAMSDLLASTRDFSFPFPSLPRGGYKSGGRQFGAGRSKGRKHAGCDLLFPKGTPVLAVADGTILQRAYPFYDGTDALEVLHGNIIVRYGEILRRSAITGTTVRKGQAICKVGQLDTSGYSMLHIELYKASARGQSLTDGSNRPFKRHGALLDPTPFLDLWSRNLPVG